jgi:hypothetical protein
MQLILLNLSILFPASTTPKPKRFLVKPSNKTAFHNEDAILECLITGYPKPQVEWQKDGTTITLADNGHYSKYGVSSLKVSAAQAADSGMYECVMGTEKAKAYLQVVGKNLFCFVLTLFCTAQQVWMVNNNIFVSSFQFPHNLKFYPKMLRQLKAKTLKSHVRLQATQNLK